MKKGLVILAAAALALSALPAIAGQPGAGEVLAVDEWHQMVMVKGAKGSEVQATQQADFRGAENAVGAGFSSANFAEDGNWLESQQSFEPGPVNGSEALNK